MTYIFRRHNAAVFHLSSRLWTCNSCISDKGGLNSWGFHQSGGTEARDNSGAKGSRNEAGGGKGSAGGTRSTRDFQGAIVVIKRYPFNAKIKGLTSVHIFNSDTIGFKSITMILAYGTNSLQNLHKRRNSEVNTVFGIKIWFFKRRISKSIIGN